MIQTPVNKYIFTIVVLMGLLTASVANATIVKQAQMNSACNACPTTFVDNFNTSALSSTSNNVLVAFISIQSTKTISNVKYFGTLMTFLNKFSTSGGTEDLYVYYLTNPTPSSIGNISVAQSPVGRLTMSVIAYSGVNQVEPIASFANASSSNNTIISTTSTARTRRMLVASAITSSTYNGFPTVDSPFTSLVNARINLGSYFYYYTTAQYLIPSNGTYTPTITFPGTFDHSAISLVMLNPSTGPAKLNIVSGKLHTNKTLTIK